jgi:hypothetical protein
MGNWALGKWALGIGEDIKIITGEIFLKIHIFK